MSSPKYLLALLSLVVACSDKSDARPAPGAKAPAPTAPAPAAPAPLRIDGPFPVVEGTRFTFRGSFGDEVLDTWETTIVALDRASGRLQYRPHNDVATVFTRRGFHLDAGGISIAGDDIDGPLPPVRAIEFPITAGATHQVPGIFPVTYTVGANEPVTVPAGTYDAWRISVKDTANAEAAVWIAPGTGVVKFQHSSGRVDELIAIGAP